MFECDLSNVLFIVTANVFDTIPEPLKDRMEMLRLSGYILEEKIEIAKKYLFPRNRKEMGLKSSGRRLYRWGSCSRSSMGMREKRAFVRLENNIKKIMRKVAFKSSKKNREERERMQERDQGEKKLNDYSGKTDLYIDRFYERTPVGVCRASPGPPWEVRHCISKR